jgi:protein-S-isoprenylcysteine O-methyltransferase Ste14
MAPSDSRRVYSSEGGLLPILYRYLFPAMWLAWAVYWWISSRHVKPTARHESNASKLSHIGPLLLAAILFSVPHIPIAVLGEKFLPPTTWRFAVAAALTAAGLLIAAWARRHLGTNWSGTVTIKEGHELVTTGPYALVRHPIYTGLILAFAGTGLAIGEWRAVLAVVFGVIAFWRKLSLEERWMREQFGETYREYSRRVPALIPFIL